MSDHHSAAEISANQITAQIVAEYLQNHPDIFIQQPQLLENIAIPHQDLGTVSLVSAQMKQLRARIADLEEELTQFMGLAAKNDRTFMDLMALQQTLLKCKTIEDVERSLQDYAKTLQLSAHLGVLEQEGQVWHLTPQLYQRVKSHYLAGRDAYLGRLNQADQQAMLGKRLRDAKLFAELGSCVILPLSNQTQIGLLCFYSQNAGYFQPHMDTLFLQHVASVAAYVIESILRNQVSTEETYTQLQGQSHV
ncbi:MAG: DUF484 family protein [Vibrio sp.]